MKAIAEIPPAISAVVCCHNPRTDFLEQVLVALRAQTLPTTRWELVVIDNASSVPLEGNLDLSWHPQGRILREPQLGLTHARLRGIGESGAPLLVFVDDDNVLNPHYLRNAVGLAEGHPALGAWGGHVVLGFESSPPEWTRPYWEFLAMKHVTRATVSRDPNDWASTPIGAGLCIRRGVLEHYREQLKCNAWRTNMDRRGRSLMSAGDQDMANTACDLGLEKGVFPELQLTHLIPLERLSEPYLLRLSTAIEFSNYALKWCRDPSSPPPTLTLRRAIRYLRNLAKCRGRERRFYLAKIRGERAAVKFHKSLTRDTSEERAAEFIKQQEFLTTDGKLAAEHQGRAG